MPLLSTLHVVRDVIYGRYFVKLPVPAARPELAQQTMVVTGANTGLGLESCKHLVRLGVGVLIMGVRNISKGEAAKKQLELMNGATVIHVWHVDMDEPESVKAFAQRLSELPRLDGVLANAGIMTSTFALSNGFEQTLNVNVINTFLLYHLLLPSMRASYKKTGQPCAFTIPNSALHWMAPVNELQSRDPGLLKRLSDPAKAAMETRYMLTKALVVYGVRHYAKTSGDAVIINTPNPSFCVSNLGPDRRGSIGFKIGEKLLARSTEEGSRTLVHGLLSGAESHGQYLNDCHVQSPAHFVTDPWGIETQAYFGRELELESHKLI